MSPIPCYEFAGVSTATMGLHFNSANFIRDNILRFPFNLINTNWFKDQISSILSIYYTVLVGNAKNRLSGYAVYSSNFLFGCLKYILRQRQGFSVRNSGFSVQFLNTDVSCLTAVARRAKAGHLTPETQSYDHFNFKIQHPCWLE